MLSSKLCAFDFQWIIGDGSCLWMLGLWMSYIEWKSWTIHYIKTTLWFTNKYEWVTTGHQTFESNNNEAYKINRRGPIEKNNWFWKEKGNSGGKQNLKNTISVLSERFEKLSYPELNRIKALETVLRNDTYGC